MALTADQRAQVRRYLGYSDISAGGTSPLEQAMDVLSSEGETIVASILSEISTLRSQMLTNLGRMGLTRAEEVSFDNVNATPMLRGEGSRLVRELAAIFGVEVRVDPFAAAATSGVLRRGS